MRLAADWISPLVDDAAAGPEPPPRDAASRSRRAVLRPPTGSLAHQRRARRASAGHAPPPRRGRPTPRGRTPSHRPPLVPLGAGRTHAGPVAVGAKAASIALARGHGVPVPPAVAVPADVAARVAAGETLATELLAGALRRWLDPRAAYAVRSSAEGEDGELRSFAGQFESRLDVPADGVLAAVRAIAAPTATGSPPTRPALGVPCRTRVGRRRPGDGPGHERGHRVQPQPAHRPRRGRRGGRRRPAATRSPTTGATPDRWVRRWGAFTESPAEPRVPAAIIERGRERRAGWRTRTGRPVDLEWAHDGTYDVVAPGAADDRARRASASTPTASPGTSCPG